jgi:hypothetical protein
VIITFGAHKGKEIERLEDGYLIWMIKTDRGDFPARQIKSMPFRMPPDQILAARKELKLRGYEFIGSRIKRKGEEDGNIN